MSLFKQIFRANRGFWLTLNVTRQSTLVAGAHSFHRHGEQKGRKFQFSSLLAAPLLASSVTFLSRHDNLIKEETDDSGWFPVVHCAEAVPPKRLPKDRLESIRALDVVAEVVEEISPAVVSVTTTPMSSFFHHANSMGSGFIVDDTGLVITNAHVVGRQQSIQVHTQANRTFDAKVLAVDVSSDLALVQLQGDEHTLAQLPYLQMAPRSQMPRPGQFVIALGSPLMLSNTVTVGVISAVDRDLGHRDGLKYLQTDAIITFGNSGGPLVNLYGEVIGVNTMIADTGLGFAVPMLQVQRFMEVAKKALAERRRSYPPDGKIPSSPIERRKSTSGPWSWLGGSQSNTGPRSDSVVFGEGTTGRHKKYLGVIMRTLTPDLAAQMDSKGLLSSDKSLKGGVLIHGVIRGSPAEKYGLLPGDIITELNGKPVFNVSEIFNEMENLDALSLTVLRQNRKLNFTDIPIESV